MGCLHGCVYCYARGFPEAPPQTEVLLYRNLPQMIERALAKMKVLPRWVSFSTASDPFQAIDEVLDVTYRVMKLLLEAGVGISFLTKGVPPEEFLELFKKYPERLRARVGVVSLKEQYWKVFEPHTPAPEQRLSFARILKKTGIDVSIRIDPLVPSVTDSQKDIHTLLGAIKLSGIEEVALSCLVMRPAIEEFFRESLPERISRKILGYYRGQPYQRVITSARTKLLPLPYRKVLYRKTLSIAHTLGLKVRICGCKNPDLPWQDCNPWLNGGEPLYLKRQLIMF